MYIPKHFEELGVAAMHELIRAHPLATLVTHSADGLNANHIPLYLQVSPEPYGSLQGHIARANPLVAEIAEGIETLVIFHGPDAYVTPSWYATKKLTGKVVPTWNYAVVHAHGVLRVIDDAPWLRAQLDAITAHNEAALPEPWAVTDAPEDYIQKSMAAILGIEIVITRMLGKWKVSQNQSAQNQAGVIAGLKERDTAASAAMAALVETRAKDPL